MTDINEWPPIDAQCHCKDCEARTKETYTLIAICGNCGAGPFTVIFRKGDQAYLNVACPNCDVSYVLRKCIDDKLSKFLEEAPGCIRDYIRMLKRRVEFLLDDVEGVLIDNKGLHRQLGDMENALLEERKLRDYLDSNREARCR